MSNALYHHTRHPHVPRNANAVHKAEQQAAGFNQRLAVGITRVFGTIHAFYFLILWMLGWMFLASAGIWIFKLDRYPFSFLLFLSNLVQLWALPVLAVGQAVLSRKQELQADEQFATTQKDDHNIEQMMHHLTAQDEELLKQTELILQLIQRWGPLPIPVDFGKDHPITPRTFQYPVGGPMPLDPEAYKKAAYPPPLSEPQPEPERKDETQEQLSPLALPAKRGRRPKRKPDDTQK